MAKGMKLNAIIYLIGIGLALLVGLLEGFALVPEFTSATAIPIILVLAGILIGVFNVNDKESQSVMIAGIALTIVSVSLAFLPALNDLVQALFKNLLLVVAPVTAVVAIKTIIAKAK